MQIKQHTTKPDETQSGETQSDPLPTVSEAAQTINPVVDLKSSRETEMDYNVNQSEPLLPVQDCPVPDELPPEEAASETPDVAAANECDKAPEATLHAPLMKEEEKEDGEVTETVAESNGGQLEASSNIASIVESIHREIKQEACEKEEPVENLVEMASAGGILALFFLFFGVFCLFINLHRLINI